MRNITLRPNLTSSRQRRIFFFRQLSRPRKMHRGSQMLPHLIYEKLWSTAAQLTIVLSSSI